MIFLDTTFLVDLLRKNESALTWLSKMDEVALFTSEINTFELYAGLFRISLGKSKRVVKKRTIELEQLLARLEILPFDRKASIESARILAALMTEGTPIGARDAMIAGTAVASGIKEILTRNKRHFERIRQIKVESY